MKQPMLDRVFYDMKNNSRQYIEEKEIMLST
jgi:hypothetical protein